VWAKQRPNVVVFHALHKQVGSPEGIKQIAGAEFFFAVVLFHVQEVENIGVPRFQIHRKRAFSFTPALIYVTRGIVEYPKHGHNAVGGSVGAFDVGTRCPNVVDTQTNPPRRLRDFGCLFECVINAFDRVIFHSQQKARTHLRLGCSGVKQRWRSVGKPFFGEQMVGLNSRVDVVHVNTHGHPHQHMLRAFGDAALCFQQIRLFQGLITEIIIAIIPVINDG